MKEMPRGYLYLKERVENCLILYTESIIQTVVLQGNRSFRL